MSSDIILQLRYIRANGIRQWRRAWAKGSCAAGGQGALGCDQRATTVVRHGPFSVGACAEHERGLAAAVTWACEHAEDGFIKTGDLAEFMVMKTEVCCDDDTKQVFRRWLANQREQAS